MVYGTLPFPFLSAKALCREQGVQPIEPDLLRTLNEKLLFHGEQHFFVVVVSLLLIFSIIYSNKLLKVY